MADIDFTPLREGDAVAAAAVQATFDAIKAGLNALPEYALGRGALHQSHMPSLVPTPGVQSVERNPSGHTYTTAYPSWVEIDPGAVAPLRLTWTAVTLGMANADKVAAFLVRMNVHFVSAYEPGTDATLDSCEGAFAIQWYDGITWTTITRTIRFIENQYLVDSGTYLDRNTHQDVAIATLITTADTGGVAIAGVRGVVAVYNQTAAERVELKEANLTAIPLHATEPP